MHDSLPISKVYYLPIEAAIRWAGLLRYTNKILPSISSYRHLPKTIDCPRWNELRLFLGRIYDAIQNGELAYGRDGITSNDKSLDTSDNSGLAGPSANVPRLYAQFASILQNELLEPPKFRSDTGPAQDY